MCHSEMTYGKNINTYENSFPLLVTKYTSTPVFEPSLFFFPTIMEEVSSLLMKATLLWMQSCTRSNPTHYVTSPHSLVCPAFTNSPSLRFHLKTSLICFAGSSSSA